MGKQSERDLVVAYLIGAPARVDTWGNKLPVCQSATQTRCVIGWNARGPRYRSNALEIGFPGPGAAQLLRKRICVNPLTWKQDTVFAPASRNQGAIFFDADKPKVIPAFASAQCQDGKLLVTQMKKPYRDVMSKILDWIMGPQNYHPIEYQLFYLNIRANALARTKAHLQR